MTQYWLTGYGRLPWQQVHPKLAGCTCTWADLDGLHEEPAENLSPIDAPITTHLWAWNHQQLWRIRIDGTDTITASLDLVTTPDSGPQPHAELVEVTERQAPTWPDNEYRVAVDAHWRGRTVTLYEVTRLMPLTFARLVPRPGERIS